MQRYHPYESAANAKPKAAAKKTAVRRVSATGKKPAPVRRASATKKQLTTPAAPAANRPPPVMSMNRLVVPSQQTSLPPVTGSSRRPTRAAAQRAKQYIQQENEKLKQLGRGDEDPEDKEDGNYRPGVATESESEEDNLEFTEEDPSDDDEGSDEEYSSEYE